MARSRPLTALLAVVVGAVVGCGGIASETTNPEEPSTTTTSSLVSDRSESSLPSSSEEFRFRSKDFELVGTLHLPPGNEAHGALVMVHGSGPQTRDSIPTSGAVKARFLDAGYAVLSWDKPGSGESTGEFDQEYGNTQRATILVDAIDELRQHPAVDPTRVGVWGLSEAGWVMPQALTMTNDIAFMIVVSGGGEDSIEQQVYQWTQKARCGGASDDEIELMDRYGAAALKATSYDEYRGAMEQLLTVANLDRYIGVQIEFTDEDDWRPWPREIDAFFDPIEVIARTTIPVLAIFGEHDILIDPIQGATAYQTALESAGNTQFHVEVIPGVGHTLTPASDDGCATTGGSTPARYLELIDEWIERLPTP